MGRDISAGTGRTKRLTVNKRWHNIEYIADKKQDKAQTGIHPRRKDNREMFCANCGKELEAGAAFCPECGTPVAQSEGAAALTENAAQSAESAQQPVQAVGNPVQPTAEPVRKKKSGRAGLIAVIAVLVLVAGAGAAGVSYYLSPEQKYNRAMGRADELMNEDAYSEAIAAYEEALNIQKSKEAKKALVKAYVAYAGELNGKEEYSDAEKAVEKAFKYDGGNADAQAELVTAYLGMGRQSLEKGAYEEAEALFDKVTALDEDNADAQAGLLECYIGYAEAAAEIADYTKALSYYRQILEWDETSVDAYRGIAHLTALQGDPLQAMSILEEGLMYHDGETSLLEEQKYLLEHTVKLFCEANYDSGRRQYEEYSTEGTLLYSCGYDTYGRLTDETQYNFDGQVASYKGYDDGELIYETSSEYDGQGNLKRYNEYSNGFYAWTVSQTDYRYDDKNNLVWQRTVYNDSEEHYSETSNEYDEEGRLLSSLYEFSDPTTPYYAGSTYTYRYNEYGDLAEEYWKDTYSDEFSSSEYEYQYDDRGRIVWRSCRSDANNAMGIGDSEGYYTYDDEDRVIESREFWSDVWGDSGEQYTQTEYYADGTVSRRRSTSTSGYESEEAYNEQGQLTAAETTYDGGNYITYVAVEYDEHGKEVRRSVHSNDKSMDDAYVYSYSYSYNVFGDMVEYYDGYNGKRTSYSYTYGLAE